MISKNRFLSHNCPCDQYDHISNLGCFFFKKNYEMMMQMKKKHKIYVALLKKKIIPLIYTSNHDRFDGFDRFTKFHK